MSTTIKVRLELQLDWKAFSGTTTNLLCIRQSASLELEAEAGRMRTPSKRKIAPSGGAPSIK